MGAATVIMENVTFLNLHLEIELQILSF